jgi:hypothetical protein
VAAAAQQLVATQQQQQQQQPLPQLLQASAALPDAASVALALLKGAAVAPAAAPGHLSRPASSVALQQLQLAATAIEGSGVGAVGGGLKTAGAPPVALPAQASRPQARNSGGGGAESGQTPTSAEFTAHVLLAAAAAATAPPPSSLLMVPAAATPDATLQVPATTHSPAFDQALAAMLQAPSSVPPVAQPVLEGVLSQLSAAVPQQEQLPVSGPGLPAAPPPPAAAGPEIAAALVGAGAPAAVAASGTMGAATEADPALHGAQALLEGLALQQVPEM